MNVKSDSNINLKQEVNLKLILQKINNAKWFFILSILSFLAIALAYIYMATPQYEASTSILIDPSGNNRVLGDNKYVEGGVSLIELEKNLYNEIGIIKSFSLINQTVQDLGFNISYHAGNWLKTKEHYKYFPFEVTLIENESQIFHVPFQIKILPDEKFWLFVDAKEFQVVNPSNGYSHEVTKRLEYSQIFSFGEKVEHDYFNFIIDKPTYNVNLEDFDNRELSFIVHDPEAVARHYVSKLEVENIDIQASIFNIVSQGASVNKEIDFLKKLTENYVQNKLTSRNETASVKEEFIRNQLRIVSDSLSNAELELEKFKQNKRALNLGATARNALGRTANLQTQKAKYRLNIEYYNSLIQSVEANRNSDEFKIPTNVGIEDPLINENIIELKRLYDERSRKRFYVTENNQEMTILNDQINKAIGLLLNNLRNAVNSSEKALRRVNSQLSSYDGVIKSLPTSENQLLNIERQSTLYDNLFNYLSQELAKTRIARAENISDTRVLDEARMAGSGPISPKKKIILSMATMLGAIFPLVWILLFASNEIIENSSQITTNTDIPLIISITNHDINSKSINSDISQWKVKESFRNLSANLKYIKPKQKCCLLGITSIMPQEGKTFCAINLGITLAEAGSKTLIIDADLRNPGLVKGSSEIEAKGLSSFLNGYIKNSADIIHPYEKLENLQYIPTSVMAEDKIHKLLSGDKMKSLLKELRETYDYIILDTPPVGLVSDYVLFRDEIDFNLFVMRRKIAKIAFLKDFKKLIYPDENKRSFIIFNDEKDKDHGYGYGQKYGTNAAVPLIKDSLSV